MSNVAAASENVSTVEIVETVPATQIKRMHSERATSFERGAIDEMADFDAYKQGRRMARNLLRADCLEKVFGAATGDRSKMLARLESLANGDK